MRFSKDEDKYKNQIFVRLLVTTFIKLESVF